MESIYSMTPTSSKFSVLSRRKINQKNNRDRNPTLVPAVSEIKQRVVSARMLRMKQLQNQIGEAHHRIAVRCYFIFRLITTVADGHESSLCIFFEGAVEGINLRGLGVLDSKLMKFSAKVGVLVTAFPPYTYSSCVFA